VKENVRHAGHAGLVYADLKTQGFTRRRSGKGFSYLDPQGKRITSSGQLKRLKSLVIPPAWEEVWICPVPEGHIQVTGRDSRGRKQYIYHPGWREWRDQYKYHRLLEFGAALPSIRRQTDKELADWALTRKKVAALVVRLLDRTLVRVGNPEYERQNRSYGLTTLHKEHIQVDGALIHLDFPGKSGKQRTLDIHDPRLARLVHKCEELPGQRLFQYYDGEGALHSLESGDVNEYLQAVTGEPFSAKDFRTWWATVFAADLLAREEVPEKERERKKTVTRVVREVARLLGNTAAVCRRYYISPAVIDAFLDRRLYAVFEAASATTREPELSVPEEAVLRLLESENTG
jgi:DNA topoisomerase I